MVGFWAFGLGRSRIFFLQNLLGLGRLGVICFLHFAGGHFAELACTIGKAPSTVLTVAVIARR